MVKHRVEFPTEILDPPPPPPSVLYLRFNLVQYFISITSHFQSVVSPSQTYGTLKVIIYQMTKSSANILCYQLKEQRQLEQDLVQRDCGKSSV